MSVTAKDYQSKGSKSAEPGTWAEPGFSWESLKEYLEPESQVVEADAPEPFTGWTGWRITSWWVTADGPDVAIDVRSAEHLPDCSDERPISVELSRRNFLFDLIF